MQATTSLPSTAVRQAGTVAIGLVLRSAPTAHQIGPAVRQPWIIGFWPFSPTHSSPPFITVSLTSTGWGGEVHRAH